LTVRLFKLNLGSSLEFYGTVWDGFRARVEPLTCGFNLHVSLAGEKTGRPLHLAFDALVLAVQDIEAHYKKIDTEVKARPARLPPATRSFDKHYQKACGFPFMTSYTVDGQEQTFTYNQHLIESKLVFLATT
jgi:hypothetical protein